MKNDTVFTCGECDAQSPKWTGQCLSCGAWGTMKESRLRRPGTAGARPGAAGPGNDAEAAATSAFEEIPATAEKRLATGIGEADRVFGGGIVDGSVTLLGGEPGIGKSTLSLMLCARLAAAGRKVLYVSGEESAAQVKLRADRLGLPQRGLRFAAVTDTDALVATLEKERPGFAVIDSVQMLRAGDIASEAGAVGQVRGAAGRLVAWAKQTATPLLLIGHVTKDGTVAGPKTLEHVVDAVLSFEGERSHPLRVLRALKNRFGSTDETGIFEMNDAGLAEIRNPSAYLLDARRADAPGSAVSCVMEGTRPLLVEIQALTSRTAFGFPARKASGFDVQRLEMLIAVLGKHGGVDLSGHDVYLNVAGGMRVKEPAADLAVLLALASSYRESPLPAAMAAWGEVGLAGELRPVTAGDRRVAEAAKLGIRGVIVPLSKSAPSSAKKPEALRMKEASTVREALAAAFAGAAPRPTVPTAARKAAQRA
jgi:DNA repair protein RadA/Sms